ncbi:MAG: 16S rRNA (adenine(1518)-N(6)/adenine(1519)-N(6))-dimethyltransferase RsmA [Arenicella sp.]|nr:16S rRNA (adenine(1518)-N(6)/adenine(1519)-N(6))-dimethyltransferase RsmA [Arenicella sp.]
MVPDRGQNQQHFSAPRRALGQNFLQDPNICRKIVSSLNIQPDDVVLEIGPGRGALTELILPLARHLHVVEFDRELAQFWQQRSATVNNLTVHMQDILKFDLDEVFSSADQAIKIIGNLPYNISSPVLFHLLPFAEMIHSEIFMLQKEVVDRMASPPGSKQYGRLSVMLQQRYQIEALFKVAPTAFFPPPKVESAVVCLMPLRPPPHTVDDPQMFARVVKQAFSQRRKTLRNTLKGLLDAAQFEALGIDPSARAETLSVCEFTQISNLIA